MSENQTELRRTLSFNAMVFYGLGTIIGAGIYVLIGEIAAEAGAWTPLSFLIAAFIASFTGLSYAELVSRYPRSAGEAVYVHQAFKLQWLTQLVGWSVVFTGLVSASTLLKGFSGYFLDIFGGNESLVIIVSVIFICLLAVSGVKQSVGVAVAFTLLEIAGLLIILLASSQELAAANNWQRWQLELADFSWLGISAAAFLAFYAFIGFEDMVNMAEEVEDASTALPKAIIVALIVSACIYGVIATVSVVVVPPSVLAGSSAPLTTIVKQSAWFPASLMSVISLVAIINGAIVQFLMASRVVYGITKKSHRLHFLAFIHPLTKTPVIATALIALFVLCFSLWLPLATLAQLTSGIILCLFILVNAALLKIKSVNGGHSGFSTPKWVPVIGLIISAALLLLQFFV